MSGLIEQKFKGGDLVQVAEDLGCELLEDARDEHERREATQTNGEAGR